MDRKKILWHIDAMKCYSVIKRNELPSREKIQKNLESILLNERSQSERLHAVRFKLYDILGKAKL